MSRQTKINKLTELYDEFAGDSRYNYILFADLCGSTEYKQWIINQGISNHFWMIRQLIFLSSAASHIENNGGTVIKTIGDEIMATFDFSESAEQILYWCVDMILSFSRSQTYTGKDRIRVKISLDFGEVMNGSISGTKFDPIGLSVDRCARLNKIADENKILFSSDFNKKLKVAEKTNVHSAISSVDTLQDTFKGIGFSKYYLVNINLS